MSRTTTALVGALIAATVTLAIIATITAVRGASLAETLNDPTIWLVEVATIALTGLAVLTRPAQSRTEPSPDLPAPPAPFRARDRRPDGVGTGRAVLIGALLALTVDIPITSVLTSPKFLIPAAIAVLVAAVEAWPDNDQPRLPGARRRDHTR